MKKPQIIRALCWGLMLAAGPAVAGEIQGFQWTGSYRLRAESLSNSYRSNSAGNDQLLASRLLMLARANIGSFVSVMEVEDSRTWLGDRGTPLGTDDVNTLELLQANIGWRINVSPNETAELKFGRMTMDMGSRRLVARNVFRNTLNAFSGLEAKWQSPRTAISAFHVHPLLRKLDDYDSVMSNSRRADRVASGTDFWGLHLRQDVTALHGSWEAYLLGFSESDQSWLPTGNRDIKTLGVRLGSSPQSVVIAEWESAYQWGHSRGSKRNNDLQNLDHRALFVHAELGVRLHDGIASELSVVMDYVSGDESPVDGKNQRFDTLFGARSFDFGPTGIYGAFARANLESVGFSWDFKSSEHLSSSFAYRTLRLAQKRDSHGPSGLIDPSGMSGRGLGQQLDARLRWALNDSWLAEMGAAYLSKGRFMRNAPDAPSDGDTSYWYWQSTYRF